MAKKLRYQDIAEPNVLNPLIKELEEVNKLLKNTEEGLKEMAKASQKVAENTPFDNYENIKKVEKAINDTKKATDGLSDVEKERERLQKRLSKLNDDRAKENAQLQLQIRQRTKELKDEARLSAANGSAYDKLSATLNTLRKRYKDLAASGQENTEEAKDLLKEVTRLDKRLKDLDDSVGQNQRSVGKYENALKGLGTSVRTLIGATGIGALIGLLSKVGEAFSANSEGAASLEKVFGRVTISINVFVQRLVKALPLLQDLFTTFFENVKNGASNFANTLKLNLLQSINVMGAFDDEIEETIKSMGKGAKASKEYGVGLDDLTSIFEGMGEEISGLIDANDALINRTLDYRRQIIKLEKEGANLLQLQAEQQVAADDTTQSLLDQIDAQEALNATNLAITEKQVKTAQLRFELAEEQARIDKGSLDRQEEAAAAFTELQTVQAELIAQQEEGQKLIAELQRDALERNLDFYIDDFDNQKTVNERIIADSTQTFERRRQLLEQNAQLAEDSFNAQEEAINASLQEQSKAILDFDELRQMTSSREIARKIQESGLDDILAGRALEIIRERRLALQDLSEGQRDLSAAERESQEIRIDLIEQEDALRQLQEAGVDTAKVLEELQTARTEQTIKNLQTQIALLEEGSEDRLKLQQELNDKLLEQQADMNKKQEEKEAAAMEKRKEIREAGFETLNSLSENFSEKQIEAIDKELEANEKRRDELAQLAEKGVQDAQNNLALEEKRQAELERKREKEIRRAQLAELALSALETYTAKVQAGDANPLVSTISDIQLLRSFIDSLPGFYEGSERVGDDLNPAMSGKDGHVIRVDGAERILSPIQNAMIPREMSNIELAMLAKKNDRQANEGENNDILKELRELRNSFDNKPAYLGSDYDSLSQAITTQISRKNKLERRHFSVKKGLFK